MKEWHWLAEAVILAIHDQQIVDHGGQGGLRDAGLLQSALTRPINRAAYADADAFELAAAYAFGIARNRPFFDGNKRTAYVAMELFLSKNGWLLQAGDVAATLTMLQLAERSLSEEGYTAWLRANCVAAEE